MPSPSRPPALPASWRLSGCCALLALLVVPARALALDPERPIARHSLDRWTTTEGLPRNTVEAVVQTSDGQLWFATSDGLARLEGGRFGVWGADEFPGIASLPATALAEGAEPGVLWLGVESGGLLRFDSHSGAHTLLRERDGLCGDAVTALRRDAEGGLWIGTRSALACRYLDGEFQPLPLVGLELPSVTDIAVDDSGGVYFAGGADGLLYAPRASAPLQALPGLPERATAVVVSDRGAVYAGTAGAGVFRYHWDEGRYAPVGAGMLGQLRVRSLLLTREGTLWVGTTSQGVYRLRLDRSDEVQDVDHLDAPLVTDLLEDREGSLWVTTQGDGVLRLADMPLCTLSQRHGLDEEKVWSLLPLGDGSVLAGTAGGGIFRLDGEVARPWALAAGLPADAIVLSLALDTRGAVWATLYDHGIVRIEPRGVRSFGVAEGLASDHPSVVLATRDGRVLVGHYHGRIDAIQGEAVGPLEGTAGLPQAGVTALVEAADGRLWIGTQGAGLALLHGGQLQRITAAEGLVDDNVNGIYEAGDGAMWIATAGGLSRLRGDTVVNIGRGQGLPAGAVYDLLQERGGSFWLSTDVGLVRIERESVDSLVAGQSVRLATRVFGTAQGMLTAECNGGTQPNMAKDAEGTIYVATTRGVVVVEPARQLAEPAPPRVLVTGLWAAREQRVLPEEGAVPALGRGPTDVAVQYLATSYLTPEGVAYRYRVEGLPGDWLEVGEDRVARFPQLAPGRYRFEVQARDGGAWGEAASIAFRIRGRPWRSPWPWAVALVLLGGLALARVLRSTGAQTRRQAELEAALEAKARELRDAALVDPLTGLRNRRFVTEVVLPAVATFISQRVQTLRSGTRRRTIAESGVFGIFLFDIDHFKEINDTLGHEAGDRMLQQFSYLLRRSVRQDDFVVRWGGEEFLILLRFSDRDHLDTYARRVREQVEQTTFLVAAAAGGSLKKTTSIGYVSIPFFDESPELLEFEQAVQLADEALYKAKEGGRNRAVRVVSTGQIPEGDDLRQMVRSLDWAIERGYARLEVYGSGS
ncbi:MAG: two-component regulator propeller domain-containing protein [Pseudomonadota bacterium]